MDRCHFNFARAVSFQTCADTDCKRKVQMTPLCKVEMALPGFRDPEMHRLQHDAADRKEDRSPPLPPLHFVT
jgi:hypothetical protein